MHAVGKKRWLFLLHCTRQSGSSANFYVMFPLAGFFPRRNTEHFVISLEEKTGFLCPPVVTIQSAFGARCFSPLALVSDDWRVVDLCFVKTAQVDETVSDFAFFFHDTSCLCSG